MRRLLETSQMIIDCMQPDGLVPLTGIGWKSCLRVRFLHGKVRQRLRSSERWNAEEWGIPINQEDMIATLLSFSFNIVVALSIMGINLTKGEVDDYLHLWRYIGYLSGVRDDLNPCISYEISRATVESIVVHLIQPDESSIFLAHHSIESLMDERNVAVRWSLPAHYQMARMLMGDELADCLQLPASELYRVHHLALFGVLRFISRLSYLPVIGSTIIDFNRRLLADVNRRGLGDTRADFSMSRKCSPSPTNKQTIKQASKLNKMQIIQIPRETTPLTT